jgi:hypothetical protein
MYSPNEDCIIKKSSLQPVIVVSSQMFGTLPLHLRAAGCLLQLLERWLVAEAGDATDNSWWHVPQTWHYGNQHQASHFEIFLKRTWDSQLLSLLGVQSRDICWWNNLPQVDFNSLIVADDNTLHSKHIKYFEVINSICIFVSSGLPFGWSAIKMDHQKDGHCF